MSQVLTRMYQSMMQTLLNQRDNLIKDLEDINDQIISLRKEARKEGIDPDAVQMNNIG